MLRFLLANLSTCSPIVFETFQLIMVDWAGFEPATFRLRIERSYQTELPALLSDNGMLEG
jgi:hypothetical protein